MAIAFYSRDAAYASFEENVKGTISPGKYADLVILDEDPRKVLPSRIPDMRVLMTVVGGRVAYYSDAHFMP
jgi:predicted amidohydrolase YtcJ